MNEIVNLNDRRNAMAGANSPGKSLEALLETSLEVLPDGSERPSTWRPPSSISTEIAAEARRVIAALDAKSELAHVSDMEDWLTSLGPLVAGNITVEDARTKLRAYCGMLEYPAACFTKASLAKAAKRFKFFPTFSELTDFLDAQLADLRVKRQRLEAIVRAAQGAGPKSITHQPIDYSPEAQERVRRVLAAAGMGLKMPGAVPDQHGAVQ